MSRQCANALGLVTNPARPAARLQPLEISAALRTERCIPISFRVLCAGVADADGLDAPGRLPFIVAGRRGVRHPRVLVFLLLDRRPRLDCLSRRVVVTDSTRWLATQTETLRPDESADDRGAPLLRLAADKEGAEPNGRNDPRAHARARPVADAAAREYCPAPGFDYFESCWPFQPAQPVLVVCYFVRAFAVPLVQSAD